MNQTTIISSQVLTDLRFTKMFNPTNNQNKKNTNLFFTPQALSLLSLPLDSITKLYQKKLKILRCHVMEHIKQRIQNENKTTHRHTNNFSSLRRESLSRESSELDKSCAKNKH